MAYEPRRVLDAGCGTGRVAIELNRRGVTVVGVDLDRPMLEAAVEKAPDIEWFRADLANLVVPHPTKPGRQRRFDTVVCAGNVMIFVAPGTERTVVERMASHLVPGGVLITGFQLRPGGYGVEEFDADCIAAGLEPEERFSSWARDPWTIDSGYAVFVHRKPLPESGSGSGSVSVSGSGSDAIAEATDEPDTKTPDAPAEADAPNGASDA